jgi:RNA polymerase sigma-70 factor (ECF subfamily)
MDGAATEDAIVPHAGIVPSSRSNERKLIRAAQSGSPDALEALVRSYWPQAVRIAYVIVRDRGVAEDLAQESMLAAVRSLDRFDRGREFGPWLHRIVTNRAIDWTRAHERRGEIALDKIAMPHAASPEALSEQLMTALRSLGAEDRAIVGMSHLLGFRANEIGRILDLKASTVRSRLSRALVRLRVVLDDGKPEEDPDAE